MAANWHDRYTAQSEWTRDVRDYILSGLDDSPAARVLELGCGTGAISSTLNKKFKARLYGLDIDFSALLMAMRNDPFTCFLQGNAKSVPFANGSFEIVYCHYFLLWIIQKLEVLKEVFRILTPGGTFIAFAEPDYAGRMDAPPALTRLGNLQTIALQEQGADISCGRELPSLLSESGFKQIKFGIIGLDSQAKILPDWWESEWKTIREDLRNHLSSKELDQLQKIDKASWLNGSRILWVPTFFAVCKKPA